VFNNKPKLNPEDKNLIQYMDEAGFEHLYRTYWKKVFSIIYHYTSDKEISSEIAQDLFASIWERREKLVLRTTIEQYLFRSAKLQAFDYLRTSIRQTQLLECALQDYCGTHNCTEEKVAYNELHGKLNLLVDQLPCRCREVYRLSQQEGLNNKRIASALLISEKTVEYHLYKAISFLRANLETFQTKT
jgi:RNA polymerase sigma-70 factor (family 1)